jgi:methionine sulfoxide reductase catalytic subunit
MIIKKRQSWVESENSVTDEGLFHNRRNFMKLSGAMLGASLLSPALMAEEKRFLQALSFNAHQTDLREELTDYKAATGYNNYYEFGTAKDDPAANVHSLIPKPWSVQVDGLTAKQGDISLEDLIDFNALEERIYRLRCVETWSMVIPWIGVPLASVIKKLDPTPAAKYVRFETLADKKQMSGISSRVLTWPYVEGLRLDEAMHPLAFIAVGMYGKELPNQNGAPLRLVVPWKYGFKSIKSIVRISLTDTEPMNSWQKSASNEYGFYSNVNSEVDHPRWSQSYERRIGEFSRRKTLMFNGYGDEVASLYDGMDLRKYF